jgi:hypothetical protein
MIYLGLKTLLFLCVLVRPSLGFAADDSAMLTVTTQNAHLYASQDSEGKVVTTLGRGEVLKPLAQGVGFATWYMVKTSKGVVGWIQAVDVASTQRTDDVFGDRSEVNAKDVTPNAQVEANRENNKREAEANRIAEARAEQERQRAAQLQRARIQAQAAAEAARIQAQGEVEAAKKRKPDMCLNCVFLR